MSRMSDVEQSTGREGQAPQPEASAVPESVRAVHDGDAADPAFGGELSVFPARSKSAGTLDLAVATDEPEQLIRYLAIAAREQIGFSDNDAKWKVLLGHFTKANEELAALNQPRARKPVAPDA